MMYEVIVTQSAKADIFETNLWMLENRPESADKWLWELSQAITSLRESPHRFPVSEESAAFDVEVRGMLFGPKRNVYRILYSIREPRVFVLRVRSTRQKRLIDMMDE